MNNVESSSFQVKQFPVKFGRKNPIKLFNKAIV
jgi:hypothetical protein